MNLLLVDNFDSFSHNLEALLKKLNVKPIILKNNDPDNLLSVYDAVIISPGPGLPEESNLLMKIIEEHKGNVPILGVCLGLQALAISYGLKLRQLDRVSHGIQESVKQCAQSQIWDNIPTDFVVGRYHSWVVDEGSESFSVTAKNDDGTIMAMENTEDRTFGVQFHPESFMTPLGKEIIRNFLTIVKN